MNVARKNDLIVLGLLSARPMHGYRLNQRVAELHLGYWETFSPSSIYSALRRLMRAGAVSSSADRRGRAPERSVHEITDEGRRRLRELVRESMVAVGSQTSLFYLGLFFARAIPSQEIAQLLEQRIARLREQIEEMDRWREEAAAKGPPVPVIFAMIDSGQRHMRFEIESCRQIGAMLTGETHAS